MGSVGAAPRSCKGSDVSVHQHSRVGERLQFSRHPGGLAELYNLQVAARAIPNPVEHGSRLILQSSVQECAVDGSDLVISDEDVWDSELRGTVTDSERSVVLRVHAESVRSPSPGATRCRDQRRARGWGDNLCPALQLDVRVPIGQWLRSH